MGGVVESIFKGPPKPKEDKELKQQQEERLTRENRREAENDARMARSRRAQFSRQRGRRLLIAAETGELGVQGDARTLG